MNPAHVVGCEACDKEKREPRRYVALPKPEATPHARHCMAVIADLLSRQPRIVHFRDRLVGPDIEAEVVGHGMAIEVRRIVREPGEDDA